MEPNLFSIDKAPRALPVWESILEDLGHPPAHRVARVLGVGRSTVYHWNAQGHGPRIACLALFWLTRWGRSLVDTQATNDAVLHVQLARSLGEERDRLAREVAALDRENQGLVYELATTKLLAFDRGNVTSAPRSHMDTAPAGCAEPARSELAWPALVSAAQPGELLERAEQDRCERPGSPAALPPGARSARFPGSERTNPPQPSDPREFAPLSPSDGVSYHGGVIMASAEPPSSDLLELGQARPLRGPADEGVTEGVSAPGLRPAQQRLAPEPGGLLSASSSWPAARTAAFHDAHGTNRGTPGAGHAAGSGGGWAIRSAGVELDARSGTPPSAAWPERPTSLGQAPDPAPRAPGAPPGSGAFDAIVRAASGPVSALQR